MKKSSLHVAIIMDGNGRWAQHRGLPRIAGHRSGADALRKVVEAAPACGVEILTAYAFSSDNWNRPPDEVNALMALLALHLETETPRLHANGVRLSVIGRRDRLPLRLSEAIRDAESGTRSGNRLHLQLAIDYSSRETILRSLHTAAKMPIHLDSFGQMPGQNKPVDLLIRTGGEQRLSDFLLWECAYAELVFTKCNWPDFDGSGLQSAINEFHRRSRRFGQIPIAPPVERGDRWLR